MPVTELLSTITGCPSPNDLECTLSIYPNGKVDYAFSDHHTIMTESTYVYSQSPGLWVITFLTRIKNTAMKISMSSCRTKAKSLRTTKGRDKMGKIPSINNYPTRPSWPLIWPSWLTVWLTVLPLSEHGFKLNRTAFHDAIMLRYGWTPTNMPPTCVCGKHFIVEHVVSCTRSRFPSIRHNEIHVYMTSPHAAYWGV